MCRLSSKGTREPPAEAIHHPLHLSEHHHQPRTGPGQDDAVSPGPAVEPSFQKSNTSHGAASPEPTHDGVHWSAVRPSMGNDRLTVAGSGCLPVPNWSVVGEWWSGSSGSPSRMSTTAWFLLCFVFVVGAISVGLV